MSGELNLAGYIWLNQLSNTTNLWWIDVYYIVINYTTGMTNHMTLLVVLHPHNSCHRASTDSELCLVIGTASLRTKISSRLSN